MSRMICAICKADLSKVIEPHKVWDNRQKKMVKVCRDQITCGLRSKGGEKYATSAK